MADEPQVKLEAFSAIAFDITDTSLADLSGLLTSLGTTEGVTVTLTAADESELTYHDVDSVRSFPNSDVRPAVRLKVEASRVGNGNRLLSDLAIDLNANQEVPVTPYGRGTRISLRGPDAWVLKARRDLEEWVRAGRPSYYWVAEVSVSKWVNALGAFGLFLLGVSSYGMTKSSDGQNLVRLVQVGSISLALGTVVAAALLKSTRFFRYLFPLGVFSFGRYGKDREAKRTYWRQIVLVVCGAGFLVNVGAAIFYARFS